MELSFAILTGLTLFNIIYLLGTDIELKQTVKQIEEEIRKIKQFLKGFRDKENL